MHGMVWYDIVLGDGLRLMAHDMHRLRAQTLRYTNPVHAFGDA